MINREFAEQDVAFRNACLAVHVTKNGEKQYRIEGKERHPVTLPPTKRQASKYRLGKGAAFKRMETTGN